MTSPTPTPETQPTKHVTAFCLLSGGIDSTTALGLAVAEANKNAIQHIIAVSIDYGQRHRVEIEAAKRISEHYQVEHRVIALGAQPKSMLTSDEALPTVSYSDLPYGISPTYVPFRNGQLLSRIAAEAQAFVKQNDETYKGEVKSEALIYFGAHAEDAANWAYPDCTPEFVGAMSNAIFIGTYNLVRLVPPFVYVSKAEIVRQGSKLGVPYHLTWSCYKGGDIHCGVCPTCRARKQSFLEADVWDPTDYATDIAPPQAPHEYSIDGVEVSAHDEFLF